MKTTIILLFVLLATALNSYSQVTEAWRKSYSTEIESRVIGSKVDNLNNTIVGSSYSRIGLGQGANYVIVKFNSNGDTLWRREYHSYTNQHDHLFDIHVDAAGNIYATGLATNYNDPIQTTRTVKYSPTGNLLWVAVDTTNTFMESNGLSKEGYIREDAGGDIYICTNKMMRVYVIRYTPNGNVVWKKQLNVPANFVNRTLPRGFEINSSGMFIFNYAIDENFTVTVLGMKCNFFGDTLSTWTNNFGNTFLEAARGMALDAAGNAYFLTELLIDYQTSRVAICQMPSSASGISWIKLYGAGTPNQKVVPTDIETDNLGNVIITASHSYNYSTTQGHKYDAVTIKYNSSGDSIWGRTLKGFNNKSANPANIKIDNNNYIYVTGEYPTMSSSSQYIQKYSPSGDSLWNFTVQGVSYWSQGKFINIDNNGSAIVASARDIGFMITKFDNATSVMQLSSEVPNSFSLSQNYPNPFNPVTNLEFRISKSGLVSLKIYDIIGKEVTVVVNTNLAPGIYTYTFDASALTSGTYFYRMETNGLAETKKMLLIK